VQEFTLKDARVQARTRAIPFHVSHFPDGSLWAEFHRTTGGYLLRFPELADFEVSADGSRISSWPAPGVTNPTVEHLYLNQVLPLALSKTGKFVFHASAVELGSSAVAFLAEAGRGKSTLAAAFSTAGRRFLTDDGLVLNPDGNGYFAMPSHPSIRLWHDSHERLVPANASAAPPVSYSSKARLLAGSALNYCSEPRALRAAYCLGPGHATKIVIEPLSAADSLVHWAKHSFLLDVEDKSLISTHFDRLAGLANRIPCFHLDYPRDFDELPRVLDAIIRHATDTEFS
jgi:hypothetical protein